MNEARKWLRSFRYAYEGIKYALSTQRNMKFHFMVAFGVMILALFFHLSKLEILFILLSVTLVIVTELINTGVEKAVDLAMPQKHPLAKIAKDVAAASVLVSAVFAVVVGLIVFYDPIDRLFLHIRESADPGTVQEISVFISIVLMAVTVIQTRYSMSRGATFRPSMMVAVSFAVSTLMSILVPETLVILMAYLLSVLLSLVLYEKTERSLGSILFSGIFGSFITVLIYVFVQYI